MGIPKGADCTSCRSRKLDFRCIKLPDLGAILFVDRVRLGFLFRPNPFTSARLQEVHRTPLSSVCLDHRNANLSLGAT